MNDAIASVADTDTHTVRLPAAACLALCDALPRAPDLDAAMRIVEGVRQSVLGDGLLTINLLATPIAQLSEGNLMLQRAWSSNPAAYPPGGLKRKTLTAWSKCLLGDGQVVVGQGDAELAQAFDDHELITALGWHSVINVPLIDTDGACFATFNALGPRDRWRGDEVLLVRLLATLATPAVKRAAQQATLVSARV
ncbi:MAG: GAF domain-containing protein [Burkholderiaceae bacterium]